MSASKNPKSKLVLRCTTSQWITTVAVLLELLMAFAFRNLLPLLVVAKPFSSSRIHRLNFSRFSKVRPQRTNPGGGVFREPIDNQSKDVVAKSGKPPKACPVCLQDIPTLTGIPIRWSINLDGPLCNLKQCNVVRDRMQVSQSSKSAFPRRTQFQETTIASNKLNNFDSDQHPDTKQQAVVALQNRKRSYRCLPLPNRLHQERKWFNSIISNRYANLKQRHYGQNAKAC